MHRIDHATRAIDGNGAGKDGFTGGAAATQTPATVVTADFLNALQEEIAGVIEGAGTALSKPSNSQLLSALTTLFGDVVITPTQISGNQNDYNPTSWDRASYVRVSSDAARTITGFLNASQTRKRLFNVGSFPITISHQSSSSVAASRVECTDGADLTLWPGDSCMLHYDSTSSRWRVLGAPEQRVTIATSVTSNQTAWAPTGWHSARLVRVDSDATARQIQGMVAPTGRARRKTLANVGSYPIVIMHEHASATAADRIAVQGMDNTSATGKYYTLDVGDVCEVEYDPTSARWRLSAARSEIVELTPGALGAGQNDYNPSGWERADVVRLSASTNVSITGFLATTSRRVKRIHNVGSTYYFDIIHESGSSSAANRVICPNNDNISVGPGESVSLEYDFASARWRVVAGSRSWKYPVYARGGVQGLPSIDPLKLDSSVGRTVQIAIEPGKSDHDTGTNTPWWNYIATSGAARPYFECRSTRKILWIPLDNDVPSNSYISQVQVLLKPASARGSGSRMEIFLARMSNNFGSPSATIDTSFEPATEDDGTTNLQALIINASPNVEVRRAEWKTYVGVYAGASGSLDRVYAAQVTFNSQFIQTW